MVRIHRRTELYKKGLNDPDNDNSVVTHLEPDILEYEVKGVLLGHVYYTSKKQALSIRKRIPHCISDCEKCRGEWQGKDKECRGGNCSFDWGLGERLREKLTFQS